MLKCINKILQNMYDIFLAMGMHLELPKFSVDSTPIWSPPPPAKKRCSIIIMLQVQERSGYIHVEIKKVNDETKLITDGIAKIILTS